MTDYSRMTTEDFQRILFEVLREYNGEQLVTEVPGLYSDLSEYFNNEVLDRWAAEQPEPEEDDDEENEEPV